jgi:hypothetical protein
MSNPASSVPTHWAARRILISLKAVFFGWLVFLMALLLMLGFNLIFRPNISANGNPFGVLCLIAVASGMTVFVVWIAVVIPVILLIPDRSVLWNPAILTTIGVLGGPLIVLACGVYNLEQNPAIAPRFSYLQSGICFPGIPSAIVGGATGAAVAWMHRRSRGPEIK